MNETAIGPAVERRPITSRLEWLGWRKLDITATDAPALFGLHPYGRSALSIWAEKAGLLEGLADNAVLRRGRWGEAAVIEMLYDERPNWLIARPKVYLRDPAVRVGATPDVEAFDPDRPGLGIVETKTLMRSVFERDWPDGVPPIGFQLQVLIAGMLAGASWMAIAALVMDGGAWEPVIFDIERHEAAEARIRAAAVRFWADFDAGLMPAVSPALDAATVTAVYPKGTIDEPPLDLSQDLAALNQRAMLKDRIEIAETRIAQIETAIKAKLGKHMRAAAPGWRITWRNEHRKAYTVPAGDPRVLRINPAKG